MRDVHRNFAIMASCGLSKIRLFYDSCENVIGGGQFDAFSGYRALRRFEISDHNPHAVTRIFRNLRDDIAPQAHPRTELQVLHGHEVVAPTE
jgi:hypothetical protein